MPLDNPTQDTAPVPTTTTKPAPPTSAPTTLAPNSLAWWAQNVLKGIGSPITQANVNFLLSWAHREGGGGDFNPLNTTQKLSGSSSFNGVGVQNYTSMAQGVQGTVKTLLNGRYGDLLAAFKTGKISTTSNFKGLSTWSGSGYSSLAGVQPYSGTKTYQAYGNTSSGTTGIGGLGKNSTPKQIKEEVAKDYGYFAAYLDDPELGPILTKAAIDGWDESRLRGAISKTKWWKTHSDSARSFDAQSKLDPATQRQQIATQVASLTNEAKQLGLVIDPKRLSQMAVNSLRYGWSGQQVRNAMVSEGKFDMSGKTGSAALTLRDNLKARASQYLVPVSDKTMNQWMKNVTRGDVSEQDFDGYLKEQAKSLFPGLAAAIDRGVTVEQYADPYRQIASQTLEIDPQQVNFLQPRWSKALQQIDPKTGDRTSMSLSDWQNTLRTDASYGYDKTQQAHQQAADLTTQLAKTFGALG